MCVPCNMVRRESQKLEAKWQFIIIAQRFFEQVLSLFRKGPILNLPLWTAYSKTVHGSFDHKENCARS